VELQINYINQILIFVIFAVSLNLLMGYTGQVSVAPAAFGALGGYAMAYLWLHHHTPLIWDLLIGFAIAGLGGLVVGFPALRLTTEWLILLTLAWQTIVIGLLTTSTQFGGAYGLQDITGLTIFGHKLLSPSDQLPLFLVLAALATAVCWRIGQSPYGRVLRAIREDELATRAVGKNVYAYKLLIFSLTSGLAGVAGVLLVLQSTVASPITFSFDTSTAIIAMVIFGGMGNFLGSILGATIIVLATPFFQDVIKLSAQYSSEWRLVAYGLLHVLVMRLRPQGLIPEGFSLRRLVRRGEAPVSIPIGLDTTLTVAAGDGEGDGAAVGPHLTIVPGGGDGPTGHEKPPEVADLAAERARHRGELVLSVSELSKKFGGIVATDELDMELHRGTITALVGPNGAGKTTVFNLLTGAIRPDRGRVLLNGTNVAGMTPNQVARLGMVRSFQDVRVFARLSCVQNVMLAVQGQPGEHVGQLFVRPGRVRAAERETREIAMRWLEFVGMDSMKDVPAGTLGFGEQKLVALARVLATEAEVLLLDEPASGIDHRWVDVMLALIESLRPEGRTVCIVEHNLNIVGRLADHIYFMELGRITAQGSLQELTGDRRLAEAYFGTA
jgi:branched-chain amino acid transport system permease protein